MSAKVIQHEWQNCGRCEDSDSYRRVELPRTMYDTSSSGELIEVDAIAICTECGGVF